MSASAEVSRRDRVHANAGPGEEGATWLYAVVRDLDQAGLGGLRGVGDAQVRLLKDGALTAVVECVDPAAFSAATLQTRLSDPAELEAVARHHHNVVVAVAALAPALPFRLATVYLGDDRVRGLLAERGDEFCETLRWLAHRTECGIKAWADPDMLRHSHGSAAASATGRHGRPGGGKPSAAADASGTAYLSRRRDELAARAEGQYLAVRCGEEIHAALSPLAVASHLHPVHDPAATGDGGLQVLNAAYLLESASFPHFAESARMIAAQTGALRIAVTGPWPAYSFADGPNA